MHTQTEGTAGQPSMLATLLSGAQPSITRPEAVRRHTLEDAGQAEHRHCQPIRNKGRGRDFTAADKALIRRVHGYMSALQLLGILNERLLCDLGEAATPFTIDQLQAEIASVSSAVPGGGDWGSLRKRLAKARRDGVLDRIDEQVIDDFAVVYSLNQKQVLTLKDILLQREEDKE